MAKISGLCLTLCFLILVATLAPAQSNPAGPNRCASEISSCGCTITRTGTYTVTGDLNADQSNAPNCIEITADHSILNLKGHTVTGNGNGRGIWIHDTADHVVIQGADESTFVRMPDDDPCAPPNSQAAMNGWNVAIQDDADYAMIQLFKSIGGSADDPNGNRTAGILMNGVTGSVAADFNACYNGTAGVIIRNSSGAKLFNLTANNNHSSGVWLNSTNGSNIDTASLGNNGSYGIWLMISSNNVVNDYGTSNNGDTGTLIGCGNEHCSGNQTSNNNRITNGGNNGNMSAGILIQKHNGNNMITITANSGNPDGYDMVDQNPHCGDDVWYNNTGTTQQSCIH